MFRAQCPGYAVSGYGDTFGFFVIPDGSDRLICLATDGREEIQSEPVWEHVSVTVRNRHGVQLQRCPTWQQMCRVKDLFWGDDDTVMQLHPPKCDYVNQHHFCLHLWRPVNEEIPRPPAIFVGSHTTSGAATASNPK